MIARSAFWVTKKRYGQWIINDGGVKCDKLDVKGLDIVRSSFPPAFRKLMTDVLQGILSNRDKEELDDILKKEPYKDMLNRKFINLMTVSLTHHRANENRDDLE